MSIMGWAEVAQLVVVCAYVHILHFVVLVVLCSPAATPHKEQMKIHGQEQGTMHDHESEPQNDKISD